MARCAVGGRQVVRVARVLLRRHVGGRVARPGPRPRTSPTICCWMSYSVVGTPSRSRRAAASNARSLMRYSVSEAARCVAMRRVAPDAPRTAAPDRPTRRPRRRGRGSSSMVPASTRDTYGMAQPASTPWPPASRPPSSVARPASSAARPAYDGLRAGQVVEVVALDGVDQAPGLARGRDQVEPAPRRSGGRPRTARRPCAWRRDSSPGSRRAATRRGPRRAGPAVRRRCRWA